MDPAQSGRCPVYRTAPVITVPFTPQPEFFRPGAAAPCCGPTQLCWDSSRFGRAARWGRHAGFSHHRRCDHRLRITGHDRHARAQHERRVQHRGRFPSRHQDHVRPSAAVDRIINDLARGSGAAGTAANFNSGAVGPPGNSGHACHRRKAPDPNRSRCREFSGRRYHRINTAPVGAGRNAGTTADSRSAQSARSVEPGHHSSGIGTNRIHLLASRVGAERGTRLEAKSATPRRYCAHAVVATKRCVPCSLTLDGT